MNTPSWDLPIETDKEGKRRNIPRLDFELSGKTFYLIMDEGIEYVVSFASGETLFFGEHGEEFKSYSYKAMRANEFVWFAHFMHEKNKCVSLILDTKNSLVTILEAKVGEYKSRPSLVSHEFKFGAIKLPGEDLPKLRHGFTDDLIGKAIAWKYSTEVIITHIYKTAHSIRSSLYNQPEPSLEATDEQREEIKNRAERWGATFFEEPARYVKINSDLYLVTFIENNRNRVNAPEGGGDMAILVDTNRVHDVGRTFGAAPDGNHNFGLITATGKFVENDDPMITVESAYWL